MVCDCTGYDTGASRHDFYKDMGPSLRPWQIEDSFSSKALALHYLRVDFHLKMVSETDPDIRSLMFETHRFIHPTIPPQANNDTVSPKPQ